MFLKINDSYVSYSSRKHIRLSGVKSISIDFSSHRAYEVATEHAYDIVSKQIKDGLSIPTKIVLEYPDTVKDITNDILKMSVIRKFANYYTKRFYDHMIFKDINIEKAFLISNRNTSEIHTSKRILLGDLKDTLQPESFIARYGIITHAIGLIKDKESDFTLFKLAYSDVYSFEAMELKSKEELEQEINFLRNVK